MPGDPADVRRAPVDIFIAQIEDVLAGDVRTQQVTAGRVQDALGFAGGPARIENEERVLTIEGHRRTGGTDVVQFPVPPHIAAFLDMDVVSRAAKDDHLADRVRTRGKGVIHILLQRHDLAPAIAAIRRNHERGLGIGDAILDRFRAEPAEDHRVHRADPGTGEHGDGRLGNHRHINQNAVAFFNFVPLQHVGEKADFPVKLLVSERPLFARLPFPQDRGLVLASRAEMPVEAVFGDIQLSADEPLRKRQLPFEHLLPLFPPEEFGGLPTPEFLGLLDRFLIHRAILGEALDSGLSAKTHGEA